MTSKIIISNDNSQALRNMRLICWERATGEIRELLRTFLENPDDLDALKKFKKLEPFAEKFINEFGGMING